MTLLISGLVTLILASSAIVSTPAELVNASAINETNRPTNRLTNRPTNRPTTNRPILNTADLTSNSGATVTLPSEVANRPTNYQTASGFPAGDGGSAAIPGSTNGNENNQSNSGAVNELTENIPPSNSDGTLGEIGIPTGEVIIPVPQGGSGAVAETAAGGRRTNRDGLNNE